ncbi:hypothetical protein HpBT0162_14590 [Helicobacter pylori]
MAQLEDLKAHEKYNLLLCLFKSDYYNDPTNTDLEGKPFKQACEECTLTFFAHEETKRLSTNILSSCVKRIMLLLLCMRNQLKKL